MTFGFLTRQSQGRSLFGRLFAEAEGLAGANFARSPSVRAVPFSRRFQASLCPTTNFHDLHGFETQKNPAFAGLFYSGGRIRTQSCDRLSVYGDAGSSVRSRFPRPDRKPTIGSGSAGLRGAPCPTGTTWRPASGLPARPYPRLPTRKRTVSTGDPSPAASTERRRKTWRPWFRLL